MHLSCILPHLLFFVLLYIFCIIKFHQWKKSQHMVYYQALIIPSTLTYPVNKTSALIRNFAIFSDLVQSHIRNSDHLGDTPNTKPFLSCSPSAFVILSSPLGFVRSLHYFRDAVELIDLLKRRCCWHYVLLSRNVKDPSV